MLVLTRKANEEILIGDDIKITLVRIRGGSVRIGIEAPREIRVMRAELTPHAPTAPVGNAKGDAVLAYADVDPMAEVFAHPQTNRNSNHKSKSANRIVTMVGDQSANAPASKVFVGTTNRNGEETELIHAPLSSFMSAT